MMHWGRESAVPGSLMRKNGAGEENWPSNFGNRACNAFLSGRPNPGCKYSGAAVMQQVTSLQPGKTPEGGCSQCREAFEVLPPSCLAHTEKGTSGMETFP